MCKGTLIDGQLCLAGVCCIGQIPELHEVLLTTKTTGYLHFSYVSMLLTLLKRNWYKIMFPMWYARENTKNIRAASLMFVETAVEMIIAIENTVPLCKKKIT